MMDAAETNRQNITLHNELSDCSKLTDFLSRYAERLNLPDETRHDLRLALEETFVNIVSYAYDTKELQTISIEFENSVDVIRTTFIDNGIAFNPLSYATDCEADDDRCEGGMGIQLIRSLTDSQAYSRVGQSNVFTLTKHYTSK